MDDPRAFLDAIRDAPDDDVHRRVYADWLDDHGEPEQAAFLRAQVELATFHTSGDDPFARYGQFDVLHLRASLRDALLAPFAGLADDLPGSTGGPPLARRLSQAYRFWAHRGLIEMIEVANQLGLTLLTSSPELPARVAVRLVALTHGPWWLPREEQPTLGHITDSGLDSFLASDLVHALEAVDFRTFPLTEHQISILIRHTKPLRRSRLRLYVRGGPTRPTGYLRRLTEAFGPQLIAVPPIREVPPFSEDEIPF